MDGAITWAQVMTLLAIAVVLCGAWWFLFAAILSVRADLNDFRLKVAEDYASREHLKEVETRLVLAINKLSDKFENLTEKIVAAIHTDHN
ncbi:hypothetical protein [Roseibium polysiphoniae]|uniref:Uncharacterized protein n=1 Tax=Roseibium polysiphoniae TaxID=2571221 RepID=A0ABR9C8P8_9HYPH|nr:hypothetical protein [Roseibium polysiphoniae]MBD8875450.1 hypothetical protein [Roseibium polysiphoniae]